jgi:hypothetical protein
MQVTYIYPGRHEIIEYDEEDFDDDVEFEEFIEPEFNPELEIHNEPRYEINELDDEPIPQPNETSEEECDIYDVPVQVTHIYPGWREVIEYDEEEFDDDVEFEEFIEPEFNPELEIHNEPRYEINELGDEPILQINEDTEPIKPNLDD